MSWGLVWATFCFCLVLGWFSVLCRFFCCVLMAPFYAGDSVWFFGFPLLVTLLGLGFCFCEARACFADSRTALLYLSASNEYLPC